MKIACVAAILPLLTLYSNPAHADQGSGTLVASTSAQQPSNVPSQARGAEDAVEDAVRRFRIGVDAGVGVDPQLVMVGAHATFGPVFHRGVEFRPGLELGLGEITTLVAINLDVIYTFPGDSGAARWRPYIGAGPSFGLSHRGVEADDIDNGDPEEPVDLRNRFDFSDTDFNGGVNFIAGARNQGGLFFELKATAGGVSNVRLMAGFTF